MVLPTLGERNGLAARQSRPQRLAPHERHDVVRNATGFAGRQHGNDVRLLQSCGELHLARETPGIRASEELRRDDFHDDFSIERVSAECGQGPRALLSEKPPAEVSRWRRS